jgi:hypothetical protein
MVADHVKPITVPGLALSGQQRICTVLLEPLVDIEKEVLLAPQHSRERLPHYNGRILADSGGCDRPIKGVGLAPALLDDLIELAAERVAEGGVAQP